MPKINIILIIMKNVLLKQFIQGRSRSYLCTYLQKFGCKSKLILDSIVPDAFENLLKSTGTFLEGLTALDQGLIASTASSALQSVLLPEIRQLKANRVKIKRVQSQAFNARYAQLLSKDKRAAEHFLMNPQMKSLGVSPYVIFGQSMQERLKDAEPWQPLNRLGSNRYLNFKGGLQKIRNDHVYGFHCFYQDLSASYQICEGSSTYKCEVQQFQVSWETDADRFEFFVSDFNNLVHKQ